MIRHPEKGNGTGRNGGAADRWSWAASARSRDELGDLFTLVTSDPFFALRYNSLSFNGHKPGHEVDIQGPIALRVGVPSPSAKPRTQELEGVTSTSS